MSTLVKAKDIPESERNAMICESLALAFEPSQSMATSSAVAAIGDAMASIGDPLTKISVETCEGTKRTLPVSEAAAFLQSASEVRFLSGLTRSETDNARARWLTMGAAFNYSSPRRTLFLGIPKASDREPFFPHLTCLRTLVAGGLVPQYGFGFYREYGLGPDYFAIGHVHNRGDREIDDADMMRIGDWFAERSGDPTEFPRRHRHLQGLMLDTFPLNVLTNRHLDRDVRGVPLRNWILGQTGPDSLSQIGANTFVWMIPPTRTIEMSAKLGEVGLVIAKISRNIH